MVVVVNLEAATFTLLTLRDCVKKWPRAPESDSLDSSPAQSPSACATLSKLLLYASVFLSVKLWWKIVLTTSTELWLKMLLASCECEVAQSRPTLCDPIDCSLPGSSIHGIFQARILEWVAISFSRRSSWPRGWTWVSRIVGRHFTVWATREVTTLSCKSKVTSLLYLRSTGHKEGSHDSVLQLDSLLEWLTELRKTVYLLLLV